MDVSRRLCSRYIGKSTSMDIGSWKPGTVKTPSLAILTVRHRPSPNRRRRFRPALGRTAFCCPVPVLGEGGWTGRLRTLYKRNTLRDWYTSGKLLQDIVPRYCITGNSLRSGSVFANVGCKACCRNKCDRSCFCTSGTPHWYLLQMIDFGRTIRCTLASFGYHTTYAPML